MTARAPAYWADGKPVAREAFYALACDPARSVVVEACAGAGKTWMLVSRILRALLAGAAPHEILAITFTRKAAGEMRERLDEWLREFAACSDAERIDALRVRGVAANQAAALAPPLARLHETLLESGRRVEIRTFHAWFSQLLRAAPLDLLDELGLQPDMELVEDLDDHRPEVFRRFHAALLADPALEADHAALIAARGRAQARKWFEALWARRVEFELADAAGVLETSVAPADAVWPELQGRPHPAEALRDPQWQALLAELAGVLGRGGALARKAAGALVDAMGEADAMGEPDAQACFDAVWAALFTAEGAPRKQLGNHALLDDVHARLQVIGDQIHQQQAHVEQGRMVRLGRTMLAGYAAYKRERGLADMDDLERCGLALLRDATLAGWVQERLDTRIRHVLIDEFQDTSPLQWHALHAWLASYAGAGGGASGQQPPGVFIVGDPKQSIYRFRRAEPRVFAAARAFVVDGLDGITLACDHTRRNAPEVLAVVNEVFAEAEVEGALDGFRPHTTEVGTLPAAGLEALREVARPPRASRSAPVLREWRDSLAMPRHEPEEVLREREAAEVAAAIREMVAEQGVLPGEIFVLCRKRQSLRLVADALRKVHVPFAAAEDFELMAAAEARDLVALLDALASPRHRLALAQALRSPLFGASDDDLVSLATRAKDDGDWWRALFASGDGRPALARARRLMAGWHAAAQRLPPHDLLDRIVAEGELRERVAASVPPEQRLAALNAIDAVLGQALTLDGARYATPYNFVRALKSRLVRVAAPVQADAVQLLTVHGAKGLEARVVFVVDSDPEPLGAENATLLIDWPVEAEHPRACAFVYSETRCPVSLRPLLAEEQAARRREELNGLYVALTRARERLVISATEPTRRDDGGPTWWERLQRLARPWSPAAAPALAPAAIARVELAVLPVWDGGQPLARGGEDTERTLIGKAVHRVLEWATGGAAAEVDVLAAAAAAEFRAPAAAVVQAARAILASPDCAPLLAQDGLAWAGNEVPVTEGGELLRIDRLVATEDLAGITWWVLDYKLSHAPAELRGYRAQLQRYARAVRMAQPGAFVRCAFITGAGKLIEIEP
jgi:ATP-dependent helicase/nuclease subunit A